MRGNIRKISLIPVLMAVILFMGMRSVPHHHCSSAVYESVVHFGIEECDDCSCCNGCHGESEDNHPHEECFVWDNFLFHIPGDSKCILHIKALSHQQYCLPAEIMQLEASLELHCWCEPYLFKRSSACAVTATLRAPPFA